jgi:acetyl-CoA carboxylase biotin carboxyl carrier protein
VAWRKAAQRSRSASRRGWTPEEVVELAVRHGLAELEVQQGDLRIRVVREHPAAVAVSRGEAAPPPSAQPAATLPQPAAATDLITVESPMVGTFYRAAAPDAAPFVNEGDLVKEGQVLCIIEAMKLMNEIEARVAGRIARVLVENAQPIEFGQPLFLIEPGR